MVARNIIIISIVFFSITTQVNQTYTFFTLLNDSLEYKVDTGDSRTYEYTKFFDNRLDNPYQAQINVIDIDGISQVFTIKNGSRFKITATTVTNNEITGTRTIDEVTYEEEMIASFIRPTTNNMSLLAESFIGSTSFEIHEDQVIEQLNESSFYSDGVYYDIYRARTSIWEKTGWLNYQCIRVYDREGVYFEVEFRKSSRSYIPNSNEITGFLLLGVILIIFLCLQFTSKKGYFKI